MTALGKYCHDFPRLAKESGYCFHLHRGKVDWTELGNLDIDEIIDNQNFQLLERNLLNVINCDLDREYNVKILDQNFVKLFKLAQLGVDYLSYCELYLDRCVILLQEQLAASQEECESLKEENQKKSEQLKKSKRRVTRVLEESYQCKKCDKLFISEVYLTSHEKRRHSNSSEVLKSPLKAKIDLTDKSQQTEPGKTTLTISTQTLSPIEDTESKEKEISQLNKDYEIKMGNLEKQLEDLRERLKSAEKTLTEKTEAPDLNHARPYNFPNPFFFPQMIPFVPPYMPQPPLNQYDPNAGYQTKPLEVSKPMRTISPVKETSESKIVKDVKPPLPVALSVQNVVRSPFQNERPQTTTSEISSKRESSEDSLPINTKPELTVLEKPKMIKSRKKLNFNKENIDPLLGHEEISPIKPVPFPRKPKKLFESEENQDFESPVIHPYLENVHGLKPESFLDSMSSVSSTPVKEIKRTKSQEIKTKLRNTARNFKKNMDFEEFKNKTRVKSDENLVEGLSPTTDRVKSNSFFKKIVNKNSPKIHELSKNLKKSLTSLYDTVSSSSRDLMRTTKDSSGLDTKSDVIEGLSHRLRELGVDPEWSGIPKETMKQKIQTLEHRRNLLARENPKYPSIRKRLEKNLFKKLNKNSILSQDKQSTSNESLHDFESPEESVKTDDENLSIHDEEIPKDRVRKPKKNVMYDLESGSESDSDSSGMESVPVRINPINKILSNQRFPEKLEEKVDKELVGTERVQVHDQGQITRLETDFSIFQINSTKGLPVTSSPLMKTQPSPKKSMLLNTVDELQTDSDFEDTFLKDFEESSLKSISRILDSGSKTPDEKVTDKEIKQDTPISEKTENQSILKNTQTGQNRPQSSVKKKVLFADYPESVHTMTNEKKQSVDVKNQKQDRISVNRSKDDTWSSDSDWDVALS